MTRRRWASPAFVIPPRRVHWPLESSLATAPLYPISCLVGKPGELADFGGERHRRDQRDPAQRLQGFEPRTHAETRQVDGRVDRGLVKWRWVTRPASTQRDALHVKLDATSVPPTPFHTATSG